jgi:hypothetical protein
MLLQEGPACTACDDILFCFGINVMLQALICSMQQTQHRSLHERDLNVHVSQHSKIPALTCVLESVCGSRCADTQAQEQHYGKP